MSNADSKVDVRGRRTMPPLRNHGGGPVSMVVPAGRAKGNPPPPPLAALRSRSLPAQTHEDVTLALPTQTQDVPQPMRPAPAKRFGAAFWSKLGGATLLAGGLLAAGYGGARLRESQFQPRLIGASQRSVVTKLNAPTLTSTAPSARPQLSDSSRPAIQPVASVKEPLPANAAGLPSISPSKSPATSAKTMRAAVAKPSGAKLKLSQHVAPVPAEQGAETAVDSSEEAGLAADPKLARVTQPAPAATLPEQPSRTEVQTSIEQIRPALTSCAAGAHGTVFANLTVAGSGRVTYSVVEGEFTAGAVGTCMARALRAATFPQFSGPTFKVRYPFVF